jgi:hypothetical protein
VLGGGWIDHVEHAGDAELAVRRLIGEPALAAVV